MKQEDIRDVREKFEDLSRTVGTLRHWIDDIQSACLSLKDDLDSLESGWEEVVELLPPKPSVGDVLALKELVAKWRRDTYGDF